VTNSLAARAPALAAQWHPTKNGDLGPADVTLASHARVWWRCAQGDDHVWQQAPSARRGAKSCPFCAGKRVSSGNSLRALRPDVAAEWHPTRNGRLGPEDVTAYSHRKVWWRCSVQPVHEWRASVLNRSGGRGCPYCSNKKVDATNSLAATQPALARQWHPTKNGSLTPEQVVPGSNRRAWWLCPAGHVWQTVISSRGIAGHGCGQCKLRKRRPATTRKVRRKVWLPSDFT
jgi:hypothetical protein